MIMTRDVECLDVGREEDGRVKGRGDVPTSLVELLSPLAYVV